jgi:integrase
MARGERTLTQLGLVKLAKTAGRHSDGGGLFLVVDETRARWVYRFTFNGRERGMGLGAYPDVSLATARARRDEARATVQSGVDPIEARKAEKAPARTIPTFAEATKAYITKHGAGWNRIHLHQWRLTTSAYCSSIASKSVDQITTLDVAQLLAVVHARAPSTASRLRTRIAAVVEETWMLHRWSDTLVNPAGFKRLVPERTSAVRNHPALPYAEIPEFMAGLRLEDRVVARALEFTILSAVRTNEALGAKWSEIDLEARQWVIPAERMKGRGSKRRAHVVPLSGRCIEILNEMVTARESDYVFPGWFGPVSSLAMFLRRIRPGVTVHGFRSTFRDWCGDKTTFPREIAEAALAHTVTGTEGAYRRGTALERRARLVDQWSDYCCGGQPADDVVDLDAFRAA